MNKFILKRMCLLTGLLGLLGGILSVIPILGVLSIIFTLCFIVPSAIIFMKKHRLIGILEGKEASLYGAIAGFIGFTGYAITMVPVGALLCWINTTWFHKSSWFSIFKVLWGMGLSGVVVLLMLLFLVGLLGAMMNAFSAMITVGIYQMLEGTEQKKDDLKIDIEIDNDF